MPMLRSVKKIFYGYLSLTNKKVENISMSIRIGFVDLDFFLEYSKSKYD